MSMAEWATILLGIESESSSALARAMGYKSLSAHTTVIRSARVQNDPKPVTSPLGSFGSVEHANTAQSFGHRYSPGELPSGWRWLGNGRHRTAYLGPDNHVYKVQRSSGSYSANARELITYARCKDIMPTGIQLAATAYLTDRVNVMAYAGDDLKAYDTSLDAKVAYLGIGDLFEGNVRRHENGDIIIIDFAD